MFTTSSFNPDDEPRGILAAIVESSDAAIVVHDVDGVIVTWNRGAERMFGYSADEVKGQSVSVLSPEGQPDEVPAILARIRAGDRLEPCERVRVTKDGRLLDVSLSVAPVRDARGRVVGASSVARDISSRKRADLAVLESERRWRSVIDSAVDGIIMIGATGLMEAFNVAAEHLFGYTESEVVGRNVSLLMPSPYRQEHDNYLARYLATGNKKIIGIGREVAARHRDGTVFSIHLAVGEMSIGGERKFIGIIHDLRPRMLIEERLREQTALARLGEMASVIAHEVRNPLAGVRGVIQVIGSRLPKDGQDAVMLKEVVTRIDALNDLVKDLLLFARPPQPQVLSVDVVSLITTTVDLLTADPAFKDVQVRVEGSAPPIPVDPELLKIVFLNVLLNAAQAMQGHGVIGVSVRATDTACLVAFSDGGPGIPPEAREKVFTPFFTTKSRGSGLGLPTAKRLVEAHRGTIGIACPVEGGTTVTVQLPRYLQ